MNGGAAIRLSCSTACGASSQGGKNCCGFVLAGVSVPALLIAGAQDASCHALAGEMLPLWWCARVVIGPDAGHAVHLEHPLALAQ